MSGKVSIIMGVYNCENLVSESIESILSQTYKNWELIICDDNSTDNTYNILELYKDKYPQKIILLKNEQNYGLAYSLNHCLQYASGDYIARQDGDDISTKNRLEKQVKFLQENKEFDLVASSMTAFDESGVIGIRGISIQIPTHIDLPKTVPFCHATIMARKYVYDNLNGYTVNKYTMRCEDAELWFRFFKAGYKGYNLKEPLYMVRDDRNAYKRRTLKSYINLIKVNFEGYRLLNMPINKYIYLLKPIISAIVPRYFMKLYHRSIYSTKTINE